MTVSTIYEPDVYNGDGSLDTFPITFNFLEENGYIKVTVKDTVTLTYTVYTEHTHYEITGSNVVFKAAYIPTATDIVIIEFWSDWFQSSDYVENSALPAENMEDDFDKLKLEVQALKDLVSRSLRVGSDVDLSTIDPTDYFDVAVAPDITALTDKSAELLALAAVDDELLALAAVDDELLALAAEEAELLDIVANWTPASAAGSASLRFKEDSDNGTSGVYIKAPAALDADVTLTLPTNDGDAGQILTTDGSGNMSWTTVDNTAAPGGAGKNTQVIVNKAGSLYSCSYFHVSGTANDSDIGDVYSTSYHVQTYFAAGYPLASPMKQTGTMTFYSGLHNGYCTLSVDGNSTGNVTFKLPSNTGFYQGILCHDNNSSYWATAAQLYGFIVNSFTFFKAPTGGASAEVYIHEGSSNGTNKIILKGPGDLSTDETYILPGVDGNAGQVLSTDGDSTLSWVDQTAATPAASDTVAGKIEIAVQSEMEAGTDNTRAVSPAVQQYHPSAAKAWFYSADMSAETIVIDKSYNITSVTDNGTGDYTITIATDFSSTAFAVMATASTTAGAPLIAGSVVVDASNVRIRVTDNAGTAADANVLSVIMFGDQ